MLIPTYPRGEEHRSGADASAARGKSTDARDDSAAAAAASESRGVGVLFITGAFCVSALTAS